MARTTIGEVKEDNLAAMTTGERAVFEETYVATRFALDIGEKLRNAREAAGLSQRELATRDSLRRGRRGRRRPRQDHPGPSLRRGLVGPPVREPVPGGGSRLVRGRDAGP